MRFRFVEWSTLPKHPRFTWAMYLWMYHRLANAGRLQIGRLILSWPMPWSKVCHGQPGYGYGQSRWAGIAVALGWLTEPWQSVSPPDRRES